MIKELKEYKGISLQDTVEYELNPNGIPRWYPHPKKDYNFIDKGYSGKFKRGEVTDILETDDGKVMLMVNLGEFSGEELCLRIQHDNYVKHRHLSGFYKIISYGISRAS